MEVCQTGFASIFIGTELISGQASIMQANDQDFFPVAMVSAHLSVPEYQKETLKCNK